MNPRDRDNSRDRKTGQHWERQFCTLAAGFGKVFTPHQIGRNDSAAAAYRKAEGQSWSVLTLPDVTVWSAPSEHHEIKHKNRTSDGMYGLEEYRIDALVGFAATTQQRVYYTIHDWEVAGAQSSDERVPNDIAHWFYADIEIIAERATKTRVDWTYYAGGLRKLPIRYWTAQRHFQPLIKLWLSKPQEEELHLADPRPPGEWPDFDTVRPPDWKGVA